MRSRRSLKRVVASPAPASAPARPSSVAEALSSIMGGEVPKPLPGVRRERAPTDLEKEIREARLRAESGNWEGAKSGTLVGLYALCHHAVFELLPEELKDKATFTQASRRFAFVLRRTFDGDVSEMVRFIRWSWVREKKRAEYAKERNFDRNRLTWQKQLMAYLYTDYLLEKKAGRV